MSMIVAVLPSEDLIIESGPSLLVLHLTNIKGRLKPNQTWMLDTNHMIIDLGGNKSLNLRKVF